MHRGLIRKKNRGSLTMEKIKESFLKDVPECGIVAVFIAKQTTADHQTKQVFNYFNKQEFGNYSHRIPMIMTRIVDFLDKKNKFVSGILQKFIQPKGDYNSILALYFEIEVCTKSLDVIRAIWSPNLVLFERAEALKRINDQKYDVYERAVTFEGEEFHSRKGTEPFTHRNKHY